MDITYDWNPDSLQRTHESGKDLLLSQQDQERLVLYYNKVNELARSFQNRKVSLTGVLKPMFKFASQQSEISNKPVLENTALLQVLSLYSTNKGLKNFVNNENQKHLKSPLKTTLTLHGRTDLPKHFLVSAGLTVSTGSKFTNFVGLAKEVEDSDGGSGFSFADLAADKAGVKMGEFATASQEQALLFQRRMTSITGETEFMPAIDSLPEGIMELKFRKDYTDLDSASSTMVYQEIDRRISDCQVYR